MRDSIVRVATTFVVFLFCTAANAVSVTYEFSGDITGVIDTDGYASAVTTASTFTGSLTYDTENYTVSFPAACCSFYQYYIDLGGNFAMSLNIDGDKSFSGFDVAATVADNEPMYDWGGDGFYFEANNVSSPAAVPPPGEWDLPLIPLADPAWWLQFRLHSNANDTFSGFDLPAMLPLADLINQEIRLSAGQISGLGWLSGDGYQITGTITDIQLVPIPGAVWLFASGLAGLGWLRRGQQALQSE